MTPAPFVETQQNERDASLLVADVEPAQQAMRRAPTPQIPFGPDATPASQAPSSVDAKQSTAIESEAMDQVSAGSQHRCKLLRRKPPLLEVVVYHRRRLRKLFHLRWPTRHLGRIRSTLRHLRNRQPGV